MFKSLKGAFTLVELLVSIAIFALMTALVVAKYGNFNQSVLLTNLAYEVALTIRTAQTYGLSVKNSDPDKLDQSNAYKNPYGVHLDTSNGNNQTITFFSDVSPVGGNGVYTSGSDGVINTFAVKRGAIISGICFGTVGCSANTNYASSGSVDITFKRPDPNALMCSGGNVNNCTSKYVEISVKAIDGNTRVITVRENGQISVQN
ncbi:MAG: hypothetical protein RL536_68 [Candidatus Parcubacteria bacterium]|jgi:prepilin-type N-terminal cleavage/methylation domain-containing protein